MLIFQIKTYSILLGLFSNFQNSWPHRKLKRQLPVISKHVSNFSIFNALNLLYYERVSLVIDIYCTHQKCLEQRRMILKKVTSGHEIWSLEIEILLFHFLQNHERYSDRIFMDNRSLNWGLRKGDGYVSCHFRSSTEVKKEIRIFKANLSNQNLFHIIRFVLKFPKQLTSPEVEASTSGYFKNMFQILNFQCLKSSLLRKCFTCNWYILYTPEMSRATSNDFRKSYFRSWDMELRNWNIVFPFSLKPWKIEWWNFSWVIDLSRGVCIRGMSMSATGSVK